MQPKSGGGGGGIDGGKFAFSADQVEFNGIRELRKELWPCPPTLSAGQRPQPLQCLHDRPGGAATPATCKPPYHAVLRQLSDSLAGQPRLCDLRKEGLLPLSAPQALVQPAAPAGSSAAFLLDAVMSLMADSQHRKLSLVRAVFFVLLPTSLPRSPSRPNRGSDKPGIGASQLIDSSPFWAERATMHGQTVQGRLNGLFQQAWLQDRIMERLHMSTRLGRVNVQLYTGCGWSGAHIATEAVETGGLGHAGPLK
ncbi:hypothetical protein AK812_SmicGene24492 [Symbiodinium microadriaticum]|uniref:Uncharacterized protein n=1 Tax=Symbiodinium microadriaticum TaxID=2951 RepID=A0A1Q9DEP6_SYMMI|nr:hypothetical protein AK812_SmicGene24492 [Symbiodinium microadriaticum]